LQQWIVAVADVDQSRRTMSSKFVFSLLFWRVQHSIAVPHFAPTTTTASFSRSISVSHHHHISFSHIPLSHTPVPQVSISHIPIPHVSIPQVSISHFTVSLSHFVFSHITTAATALFPLSHYSVSLSHVSFPPIVAAISHVAISHVSFSPIVVTSFSIASLHQMPLSFLFFIGPTMRWRRRWR